MNKEFFIKQIDEILNDFEKLKSKATTSDLSMGVSRTEITTLITKSKAAIVRITGINSEYYKDVESIIKKTNLWEGEQLKYLIGPVMALKSDMQNDYLKSLSDIIQSEVFSDYLEMAEHLLTEGYKDPAAVIIGSTLETHLKELCKSNNIEVEYENSKGSIVAKKADLLNSELAKAGIYSSPNQKQIVAWLGIRNSAAHGNYTDYSNEEVKLMLLGIRHFIITTK